MYQFNNVGFQTGQLLFPLYNESNQFFAETLDKDTRLDLTIKKSKRKYRNALITVPMLIWYNQIYPMKLLRIPIQKCFLARNFNKLIIKTQIQIYIIPRYL